MCNIYIYAACGRIADDRFSYGVLWPLTRANSFAEVFCTDINPSFGFGPYATRSCISNDIWGRVDTSQCNIRRTRRSNTLVYSNFVTAFSGESGTITIPEIEQVR